MPTLTVGARAHQVVDWLEEGLLLCAVPLPREGRLRVAATREAIWEPMP